MDLDLSWFILAAVVFSDVLFYKKHWALLPNQNALDPWG